MADKQHTRKPRGKPRQDKPGQGKPGRKRANAAPTPAAWVAAMEACPDAETLNDKVITPFVAALEDTCRARGYLLNIYGPNSNLIISTEDDVEAIYQLVESYFDAKDTDGEAG